MNSKNVVMVQIISSMKNYSLIRWRDQELWSDSLIGALRRNSVASEISSKG